MGKDYRALLLIKVSVLHYCYAVTLKTLAFTPKKLTKRF